MALTTKQALDSNRARDLDGLFAFLRRPSVSNNPARATDVRSCAEWLAGELRTAGLQHVALWETDGHPIVYGDWLHAGSAPTVLLYGHYDVQPPEPLELWQSPPFEPTVRDERIYARGASDDKGQVYMHVAAIRALFAAHGALPVNLKVCIEGEEEVGSPNLEQAVSRRLRELRGDVVVIPDTAMFAEGQPALCYGLRGLAYFELAVEGANTDLHSGGFGGAVPNACQALANLLCGLKDGNGRIALDGFYDDVRPIGEAERAAIAALPHDDTAYQARLGLAALAGETGFGTLERVWTRPSLDVNGIWGGYSGPGSKTVLPAKAGAKLSFRLVPDQHPERVADLLRADLARRCPPGITFSLMLEAGAAAPWVTSLDHPFMRAAAQALATAFGREPVHIRAGGSIPVVATFDTLLRVPVVLLGAAVPTCNAHAPNEHFPLDSFHSGAYAAALMYLNLAAGATV